MTKHPKNDLVVFALFGYFCFFFDFQEFPRAFWGVFRVFFLTGRRRVRNLEKWAKMPIKRRMVFLVA
jgi:hypothetical protein